MEWLGSITIPPGVELLVGGAVALMARLSLMIFLLPGVGELGIPIRVRIILALTLTFAIFPMVVPMQLAAVQATGIVPLIAYEALIGFALGFSFRVLVMALSIAGTAIAQSINLSQLLSPTLVAEANPSVSMLLVWAGTALFVTFDLHTASVGLLMDSYALFPFGEVPDTGSLARWATERTAGAFSLAISLALPFLLIGFLYNLVLGLINQAMPQMMVTFIGVPANVLAGFVVLALSVVTILTVWSDRVAIAFEGFW